MFNLIKDHVTMYERPYAEKLIAELNTGIEDGEPEFQIIETENAKGLVKVAMIEDGEVVGHWS